MSLAICPLAIITFGLYSPCTLLKCMLKFRNALLENEGSPPPRIIESGIKEALLLVVYVFIPLLPLFLHINLVFDKPEKPVPPNMETRVMYNV